MKYFLGIPIPVCYANRVEAFQREMAGWALRSQRSDPHISIKGDAGLDEGSETMITITEVARRTAPFPIQLGEPAVFEGEPVLYLSVTSLGWSQLNRTLIDTIAARTGVEMEPLEISGWIPHLTIFRLKPELLSRCEEIFLATANVLSPYPTITADRLRMYRQERDAGQWAPLRDFPLG